MARGSRVPSGDGWYRTGNLREWDGDLLRTVDQKKHAQVLETGESVYDDPVETALHRRPHVAEALSVARPLVPGRVPEPITFLT